MSTAFWIKIVNWEKYNPRKDIKEPKWFAFYNRMVEDEDFDQFKHGEFKTFIYLMSKASQKNHPVVFVQPSHAFRVCNISHKDFTSAVKKLRDPNLKIITDPTPDEIEQAINFKKTGATDSEQIRTESVRPTNADVQNPYATGQDRTGQGSTEQDREGEDSARPLLLAGFELGPIEEFNGSAPYFLSALNHVPKALQLVWLNTWSSIRELRIVGEKTVMKNLGKNIPDERWAGLITNWYWSEKPPLKLKAQRPTSPDTVPELSVEEAQIIFNEALEANGVKSLVDLLPKSGAKRG